MTIVASLASLPRDILLDNIIPYLSIRDFLSLSATCRAFHAYATDEVYWRKVTASTFCFPAQPIRNEGWRDLYKNLTTARVFTWGSTKNGRLGHSYKVPDANTSSMPTPKEIPGLEQEIVVDIKAGGWSTTVLTSSGVIFSCGSLRADEFPVAASLAKLKFPRRHSTKIAQVSSGRSHILALSQKGEIWLWQRIQHVGHFVKFLHIDTRLYATDYYDTYRPKGTVQKIVAGWDNTSAALVNGVGIVVWWTDPEYPTHHSEGMLVDGEVVPGTHLTAYGPKNSKAKDALAEKIGEVVDMIGGEGFLVFLTRSGGVWAVNISGPGSVAGSPPVQLISFSAPVGSEPMSHISGSFRKFAVFNKAGLVYLGSNDTVKAALNSAKDGKVPDMEDIRLQPEILPSLQSKQIVAISFGDYHYLALTASGKVFSWGTESMNCGCLGLGPRSFSIRRGVQPVQYDRYNSKLDEPQEVYFTREQQLSAARSPDSKLESNFFVFNIAAAGWHSGALVLVPQTYEREADRLVGKQAESIPVTNPPTESRNDIPSYPRPPLNPYHVPHHFNRPLGEAGHGGRVHWQQQVPAQRLTSEAATPGSSSSPFINVGPAMPGGFLMPNPTNTEVAESESTTARAPGGQAGDGQGNESGGASVTSSNANSRGSCEVN